MKDLAIAMRARGDSYGKIGAALGMHKETVRRICDPRAAQSHRQYLDQRQRGNMLVGLALTDADRQKAAELYRTGTSSTELAKVFGYSDKTMRALLRSMGVTIRRSGKAPK